MNEQKQEISSSSLPQLKAEAGLKRVFNVEQKSYYEKLKAEMAAIARGRTAREMHAEKDRESLRAWVERKRRMIKFLEDKIIPEQEREIEEVEIDISFYSSVEQPIDSGGRLAFAALEHGKSFEDGEWVVVTDGGEELGEEIYMGYKKNPVVIGGKIAFVARRYIFIGSHSFERAVVAFEGGAEVGGEGGYLSIGGLTDVNGQLAFFAETADMDKAMVAVIAGKEYHNDYHDIFFFQKIDAGVAFIAIKGDNSLAFVKIVNGEKEEKKINIESGMQIKGLWVVGGRARIMVEDLQCRHGQDNRFVYVDENGTPVSNMYKGVAAPKIINGRFVFKAQKYVETSTPFTQG